MSYNDRVEFQQKLDELFPEGAQVWQITVDRETGEEFPGAEFVTGRVWCTDVRTNNDLEEFHIWMDSRWMPEETHEYFPPMTAWIEDIEATEDEDVFESWVMDDTEEEFDILLMFRFRTDRPIPAGAREYATELRLNEFFPLGVEIQEAVNAEGDTG